MRKISLLSQLTLGLLVGVLFMPLSVVRAQWTVHDPPQYILQVKKRIEEANRWVQTYQNAVQQLTTLGGILKTTEDLMAKQRNAISTMSNIGRTIRGMYQLKDQLEAIVVSRMRAFKSIESRLRNGIFDPEADMRDFDEYLRNSIGRRSQDTIATRERLMRMDNELKRMQDDLEVAEQRKAWAVRKKQAALKKLEEEDKKTVADKCALCISSLNQELAECEQLIAESERVISDLRCGIENRVKKYNVELEERIKFGEQVQSMNEAWGRFNNSLDELQRVLSKVN
jgi:chromosome segregation ATPase